MSGLRRPIDGGGRSRVLAVNGEWLAGVWTFGLFLLARVSVVVAPQRKGPGRFRESTHLR